MARCARLLFEPSQLSFGVRWTRTFWRDRVRARVTCVILVFLLVACRLKSDEYWRMGGHYHLTLALTVPATLTPERQRYHEPISDSVKLVLTVDSLVRDTVFGRVDGDTRHFPVAFQAIGGGRFIATGRRERWRILINSHATDTGLTLEGDLALNTIRGDWQTRYTSPARGSFALRPAT